MQTEGPIYFQFSSRADKVVHCEHSSDILKILKLKLFYLMGLTLRISIAILVEAVGDE